MIVRIESRNETFHYVEEGTVEFYGDDPGIPGLAPNYHDNFGELTEIWPGLLPAGNYRF